MSKHPILPVKSGALSIIKKKSKCNCTTEFAKNNNKKLNNNLHRKGHFQVKNPVRNNLDLELKYKAFKNELSITKSKF